MQRTTGRGLRTLGDSENGGCCTRSRLLTTPPCDFKYPIRLFLTSPTWNTSTRRLEQYDVMPQAHLTGYTFLSYLTKRCRIGTRQPRRLAKRYWACTGAVADVHVVGEGCGNKATQESSGNRLRPLQFAMQGSRGCHVLVARIRWTFSFVACNPPHHKQCGAMFLIVHHHGHHG